MIKVIIPTGCTKGELLSAIAEQLLFPDYFGHNWDALYDCLSDLSWLKEGAVVIEHNGAPLLDDKEMAVYASVLNDAGAKLAEVGGPVLEVRWPVA